MRLRRRRVRLHLQDGQTTLDGVIVGSVDGHYLLKVAKLVKDADQTIDLGGEVEVPKRNVSFIQRLADA